MSYPNYSNYIVSGMEVSTTVSTTLSATTTKYTGLRGDPFKKMLETILVQRSKMAPKYIEKILSDEGLKVFDQAFTHATYDEINNYEVYELLGDSTINKCVVWYLARRFPQLKTPEGVAIISKMKTDLVSKKTFCMLGDKLGLWEFVSCSDEVRKTNMKKTLEDVFESFIGALEFLLDNIREGCGYSFCYNIVGSLFDEMNISLRYQDIYDAKTRLKELFDFHKGKSMSEMKYGSYKGDDNIVTSEVFVTALHNGKWLHNLCVGEGKAHLKIDAEKRASEVAIRTLKEMGIYKPIPEIFKILNKNE